MTTTLRCLAATTTTMMMIVPLKCTSRCAALPSTTRGMCLRWQRLPASIAASPRLSDRRSSRGTSPCVHTPRSETHQRWVKQSPTCLQCPRRPCSGCSDCTTRGRLSLQPLQRALRWRLLRATPLAHRRHLRRRQRRLWQLQLQRSGRVVVEARCPPATPSVSSRCLAVAVRVQEGPKPSLQVCHRASPCVVTVVVCP